MQPIEQADLDCVVGITQRFLPEIFLCIVVVLLILGTLFSSAKRWIFYTTIIGIAIYLLLIPVVPNGVYANALKFVIGGSALLTVLISGKQRLEYYLFILFVLTGAGVLIISYDFFMILLSMELISISSYVLVAGTEPNKQRAEAAWKFFLFGSVATAIMIFGMTYVYGTTGELSVDIKEGSGPLFILGAFMTLSGFLFKMTAAPFHFWAPDVYESTPAPIVAFLSVVPKIAGLTVVIKLANTDSSKLVVAAIALFTIIVGTLAALNQTNSKRMMAYSSVAQAGFLLIIPATNLSPLVFYAIVFAIMNYVVFIVIHQQEQSGKGILMSDFNGIGYTNSFAAISITLGLISLTGLPPVAGFMAKLFVFSSAWTKYADTGNLIFLALFSIGLLATAASLFFYLKIPFYAFFRRSEESEPIKSSFVTNLLLIILVGLLLALFLAPGIMDELTY